MTELARLMKKAKQAGAFPARRFCLGDSSWKADDAAWFQDHPHRRNRLRRAYPDEHALPQIPGNELCTIVRQIEPGFRSRLPYYCNRQTLIANEEKVIRALYDDVVKEGIIYVPPRAAMTEEEES
jgi:hypothetical protein